MALALSSCGGPGDVCTETVGPAGGDLRLDGFVLTIPKDALRERVSITVTRTTETPPAGYDARSEVYAIEPFDFEMSYKQARVTIQAPDVEAATVMWTAADGESYEPRLGIRGQDYVAGAAWRFGRVFVGARRACESPALEPRRVEIGPNGVVRGFGWSFSLDGLRQHLVVAVEDDSGFLRIEEFDASTLQLTRRVDTDVPLSSTVPPVVDRLETAVYAGTSDGGAAIVGVDPSGTPHVRSFPPEGELLRIETRVHGSFTEVDLLARDAGQDGRLSDNLLHVRHDEGLAELLLDGFHRRWVLPLAPVLDLHASLSFCDPFFDRDLLVRHDDGTAAIVDSTSAGAFPPEVPAWGPLGVDAVGALVAMISSWSDATTFDYAVGYPRIPIASPQRHWLVPRSAGPPVMTGPRHEPVRELPLPAGGVLAATDLDGDGIEEILRLDGTGTVQFVDTRTGEVGQIDLPSAEGLRLELGVRSVIDHEADLCARPRSLPSRSGFAIATSAPGGIVVYSPTCPGG